MCNRGSSSMTLVGRRQAAGPRRPEGYAAGGCCGCVGSGKHSCDINQPPDSRPALQCQAMTVRTQVVSSQMRNDPGRAARALWRGDSFLASLSDSDLEALLGMGAARTYE